LSREKFGSATIVIVVVIVAMVILVIRVVRIIMVIRVKNMFELGFVHPYLKEQKCLKAFFYFGHFLEN
jgi:hypothetical protein